MYGLLQTNAPPLLTTRHDWVQVDDAHVIHLFWVTPPLCTVCGVAIITHQSIDRYRMTPSSSGLPLRDVEMCRIHPSTAILTMVIL